MGRDKVRYYVVKKGFAYWRPNERMKAAGFKFMSLGPDGPKAEDAARAMNRKWDAHRRGDLSIEVGPTTAPGSLGEAFARFRETSVWRDKQPRTREDWERGWRRIDPIFGDVDPKTVTLDQIADFRDAIRDTVSPSEAHRVIKIWRALWKKAAAMGYCIEGSDPSRGMPNTQPPKRQATWTYAEVRALIKHAWRMEYYSIAAGLSIMWDTLLSPVDTRQLKPTQLRTDGRRFWFELHRQKTGRTVYATLSRRSMRILKAYLDQLGNVTLQADAELLRDTTGKPFDKNRFGKLFRRVREDLYPGDQRVMADMRRSGSLEAIQGGAVVEGLSAKLANTLSHSNFLFATYVPTDLQPISDVDQARENARKKNRKSTESVTEPAMVTLFPGNAKSAPK